MNSQPLTIQNKKILIGMPSYSGMVPAITLQSLLQLIKPCPTAFMTVERQRIDKARNAIAMEALNKEFDYLLFVDDDNPIPPDTLLRMLEDDKDVVTAPILGRNPDKDGKYNLCVFYSKTQKVDGKPLKLYFPIDELKGEEYLHKVEATGTGCLLIKRKVLEAMYKKYKDYMFEFGDIKFNKPILVDGKLYDRRTMSEDCEFSERVVNLGFEIWVDTRIRPIHLTNHNSVRWGNGIN
jgi:glycosyltransferase involved in cell wall biosynthesis